MDTPTDKGANDRDVHGRFLPGWKGGPGNPHVRRTAQIRELLLQAVSDDDLRKIVKALVEKGKAGDVMAAREVLDRLVGRPQTPVELSGDLDQRLHLVATTTDLIEAANSAQGFHRTNRIAGLMENPPGTG